MNQTSTCTTACLDSTELSFGDCLYPSQCLCGPVDHFPEDCQPVSALNWAEDLVCPA